MNNTDAAPTPSTNGTLPNPTRDRRRAVVIGADEHRVNDAVADALADAESLYQRCGQLVRVVEVPAAEGEGRTATPRIDAISNPALRDIVSRLVMFEKVVRNGTGEESRSPAHPPEWCISAVGARGAWPGVRPLNGVVPFPALRPDGSILTAQGYDSCTGMYLHWPHAPLSIPEAPTIEDAKAAVNMLLDAVADFPFQAEMHKSAWLSALLTPVARSAFDGPAPLFLADANVRAAGKGMLLEIISRILTRNPFPIISYPANRTDSEEELRKKITTFLLYGDRLALFDNLTGGFGDGTLDRALTGTEWQDRLLGGNRQYRGPLTVTFYATGNNVIIRADTARRICHIRLESPLERPEERSNFRRPHIIQWVVDNREALLCRALTILRAYYVAGRPDLKLKPWGSFEAWSRLVRNAIVWCGLADPGDTRAVIQEQADESLQGLRQLVVALDMIDPERNGLTAGEIVGAGFDAGSPHSPEVREMLCTAINALVAKPDARKLGTKLRGLRRRVVDDRYIDLSGEDRRRVNRWAVFDLQSFASKGRGHAPHAPHPPVRTLSAATGEDVEHVEDVFHPETGETSAHSSNRNEPWRL